MRHEDKMGPVLWARVPRSNQASVGAGSGRSTPPAYPVVHKAGGKSSPRKETHIGILDLIIKSKILFTGKREKLFIFILGSMTGRSDAGKVGRKRT